MVQIIFIQSFLMIRNSFLPEEHEFIYEIISIAFSKKTEKLEATLLTTYLLLFTDFDYQAKFKLFSLVEPLVNLK